MSTTPAPLDAAGSLRARIVGAYHLRGNAAIVGVARDALATRTLIRDRVDSALLRGAVEVTGEDMRFTPADGLSRHAGLVVVRYADNASAQAAARTATGHRSFGGTEVLTPMTSARHGRRVIVLFTESAGDAVLRRVLDSTATEIAAE